MRPRSGRCEASYRPRDAHECIATRTRRPAGRIRGGEPGGRLTPTPRTPQRQMNGESTEMLTRGALL